MNYITGEMSFDFIWSDVIGDGDRERILSKWDELSDWVKNKSESINDLSRSEADERILSFIDDLAKGVEVPDPMLVTLNLSYRYPFERTETSDMMHQRIIDTYAVLSLYKECLFYKKYLDKPGYDGPPRNLWEDDRNLNGSEDRFTFSRDELKIRRLLK